jgi:hypothetical protein
VSPRKQRVPQVAGAVRETRPTLPLGLCRWDRFKRPLTCGNSSLEGAGTSMLRASQRSKP